MHILQKNHTVAIGAPIKVDGWTREYKGGDYIREIKLASNTQLGGAFEGMSVSQKITRAAKSSYSRTKSIAFSQQENIAELGAL